MTDFSKEALFDACKAAQEQAKRDMPYTDVGEARPYEYHEASNRWYVEVDLTHSDSDEGAAVALYRVWTTDTGLKAVKVDIRAVESE